jgi:hypothetical protein
MKWMVAEKLCDFTYRSKRLTLQAEPKDSKRRTHLSTWRSKRNAYDGKSSGVVNLLPGDNATFLLVATVMACVAISNWAFESTASAIH